MITLFQAEHPRLIKIGLRVFSVSSTAQPSPIIGEALTAYVHEGLCDSDPWPKKGVLHTLVPIIFDYRGVPTSWQGLQVEYSVTFGGIEGQEEGLVPLEFRSGYEEALYWDEEFAPEKYESLVDRCPELILKRLWVSDELTREELLNALAFGDFDKHKQTCKALRERRLLR